MSSSTGSYNLTSNVPLTPENRALTRSFSSSYTASTSSTTSTYIYKFSPKSPTLTRSLSASSTSSTQSQASQPSSPFLEPSSRYESRHTSELAYRRMPDSPKPHYYYERPDFFIPKRLAPKAPGSPKSKLLFVDGLDEEMEDDE